MQESARQLEHLGREWADAELRGDTTFLRSILTGDFAAVGPRGFVLTGEEWLERHSPGKLRYESFGWDDVTIRVYGDAAVATGRQTTHATYADQVLQGEFRATLIFVSNDGGWLLAGLHLSPILGAP